VRLIKKQDQSETRFTVFNVEREAKSHPCAQRMPAWMEHADATRKAEGQLASDPAQIEKAAFENGFLQGEKAGLEAAEKKLEALMKRYADAVLEIGKLKPALYRQAESEVVRLALEVAKKVVHREVSVDREIIQTLIKVALGHVAVKSPVTVHLHPADHSLVLDQRAASARTGESGQEIVLLADNSIERGGCLIETECGDVDARIGEKFREVERAFFSGGD
jgi:flagellar assembly protein FliH